MASLDYPSAENFHLYTPVMQQYLNARLGLQENTLLLFRMGDFYEAFFHDAELISRELDITLTARSETNHSGGKIPMAGVPAKAVKPYIARLLEKGYKVSIAEQMADPKTCKGLVPREVCATYTPGTLSEIDFLKASENNYLAALFSKGDFNKFGLAYADISTGEFYLTEIEAKEVEAELFRIKPAELIIPSIRGSKGELDLERPLEAIFSFKYPFSLFDIRYFDEKLSNSNLCREFRLESISHDLKDNFPYALRAAGALIEYFIETQKALFLKNSGKLFSTLKTYQTGEFMCLDLSTRKNLELTRSIYSAKSEGSLLNAIDRTNCNLGKRRLTSWLEQPLYNLEKIHTRQEAVSILHEDINLSNSIQETLSEMTDLSRLAQRLALESINPREIMALKDSLAIFMKLSAIFNTNNELYFSSPYFSPFKHVPVEIQEFTRELDFKILDNPNIAISEGGIFRKGIDAELDRLISLMEDGNTWLTRYEEELKEKSSIKTLKVTFNKIHGYYIEISKANIKLIPDYLTIKQTLVNAVRCTSDELKDYEENLVSAEFKRNSLEQKLFNEMRSRYSKLAPLFKDLANAIADLSVLNSFAIIARERNYIRPLIDNSDSLFIEAGRHPVLEQSLGLGNFVDNDISLHDSREAGARFILLTGPNMAGKSTYMRQNALIILLAQMGSFVPAFKARIGLVDRIFTRIGASDDISSGQSTFMVEMNEVANIVNGMSSRSFLVLDEVGRGTSTYDGVSIAWAIIEYILAEYCPRTIFATHYHELAELEKYHNGRIQNAQMAVSEATIASPRISFLHKVKSGSAKKSYGIEVAKLAGLPQSIINRALLINEKLELNFASPQNLSLNLSASDLSISRVKKSKNLFNEDFKSRPLFNWQEKEKSK